MAKHKVEMLKDNDTTLLRFGPMKVEFNIFKPAEVEAMTGLSAELQRVWRRRDHLPKTLFNKHATFSTLDVAYIALLYRMTVVGSGIELAKREARRYALPLCSHLLWGRDRLSLHSAYGGDLYNEMITELEAIRKDFYEDDEPYLVNYYGDTFERMSLADFEYVGAISAGVVRLDTLADYIRATTDRALFVVDDDIVSHLAD